MSKENLPGATVFARRYSEFRDASGSWTFEIWEYQSDLNSVVPADVSADPGPQEAYRAAVFLEGFIQEQKSTGTWADDALDEFASFESTAEVEAVARALRETGGRTDQ